MNRNDTLHSGLSLLGLAPRNQSVLQNSVDTISLLNGVLCFQTILACESDAKRAYLVSSIIVVIRFHKNLLESAQMRRNARGKARPIRLLRSQHECCENQSSQNSFHRKDSSKNRRTLEHSRTPVSTFLKTTNNTHIYMFTSIVHARIQNNISQSYSYQNPLSIVASDVSFPPSIPIIKSASNDALPLISPSVSYSSFIRSSDSYFCFGKLPRGSDPVSDPLSPSGSRSHDA